LDHFRDGQTTDPQNHGPWTSSGMDRPQNRGPWTSLGMYRPRTSEPWSLDHFRDPWSLDHFRDGQTTDPQNCGPRSNQRQFLVCVAHCLLNDAVTCETIIHNDWTSFMWA